MIIRLVEKNTSISGPKCIWKGGTAVMLYQLQEQWTSAETTEEYGRSS